MKTIYHDFEEPVFSFHRINDGFDPGYLHFHTYYEVSVVKSGRLAIICNGDNIQYDKPCIILHKPYSFHAIIAQQGVTYDFFVFHFDSRYVAEFAEDMIDLGELYVSNLSVIPITDEIERKLYPFLDAYSDSPDDLKLKYLVLAAVLDVASRYPRLTAGDASGAAEGEPEAGKFGYVNDIVNYINAHYSETLTADTLAKQFFISRQKLDADFKKAMLVTLKQYIIDIRIVNSMKLLCTGAPLLETAFNCGFINESHFIKTFKQHIGVSPYQFAKNSSVDKN